MIICNRPNVAAGAVNVGSATESMFLLPNFGTASSAFNPTTVTRTLYIGDGLNNPISNSVTISGYTSFYFYGLTSAVPNDDLVPLLYNRTTSEIIPSTATGRVFAGSATTSGNGTVSVSLSGLSLSAVPLVVATPVNTSASTTVSCNITAVSASIVSFRLFRSINVLALGGNPVVAAGNVTFHYFVYY